MATSPPRPPAPPLPPRTGSNVVAIVLLALALIVVVSGLVVWTGLRFLSHSVQVNVHDSGADKKQVSIKTPFGGIEVNNGNSVSEAALGLPIYPGAKPLKDEGSARVNLGFPNEKSLQVVAAKFETPDPIDKVEAFYHQRVGSQVTKFTAKDSDGKTVFEIKHKDNERVVTLKSVLDGTRIELVRVSNGGEESN
jgi:hypothetical protein